MADHAVMERVWDAHTDSEFVHRDVQVTMSTMTASPTVLHVPTAMGGVGRANVKEFYERWFIGRNPDDLTLRTISRTVGDDRIVDEMVVSFTHDIEVPWILPAIGPTGRSVRIPVVAVVGFQGELIDSEHIFWDQASVLSQTHLLDTALVGRLPLVTDQLAALDGQAALNSLTGAPRA